MSITLDVSLAPMSVECSFTMTLPPGDPSVTHRARHAAQQRRQRLPLVHLSAQAEPILSMKPPNDPSPGQDQQQYKTSKNKVALPVPRRTIGVDTRSLS